MRRKKIEFTLIGIGAVAALIVCAVAYLNMRSANDQLAQMPTETVLVASRDIPEQSRIELSMLTPAKVSQELVPSNPLRSPEEVVGRYAAQRIYRGDVLTAQRVADRETIRRSVEAGRPARSPSMVLDRDHVMITMPATLPGNFAGQSRTELSAAKAVRAGDFVDVVVTTPDFPDSMNATDREYALRLRPWDYMRTSVMLQNLPVLQVGSFAREGEPVVADAAAEQYITFAVDRDTALQLKLLKDLIALGQANVDYVVRAPNDIDILPTEAIIAQDPRSRAGALWRQEPYQDLGDRFALGRAPSAPAPPGAAVFTSPSRPAQAQAGIDTGSSAQAITGGPGSTALAPSGSGPQEVSQPGGPGLRSELPPTIPEADTVVLFLLGLGGIGALALRRRSS